MEEINNELLLYLNKIKINSVKEDWVRKNLQNLYQFMVDKDGDSFSEKVYIYKFGKKFCKICNNETKFLSYSRGYREYCSKKCSNSDSELKEIKLNNYKNNCLSKYGVTNVSKLESVRIKIRNSKKDLDYTNIYKKSQIKFIEKYGVDNPSKSDIIKKKKKKTFNDKLGVDNPFMSEYIKSKIREIHINKIGVDHPLKSDEIKQKIKETNIERYGVDNFTKSEKYKEIIFEKYRSGLIKTNLNTNINYHSYIGLGKHLLKCDNNQEHIYETNSHLYHSRVGKIQCTICYPVNSISSFKEKEIKDYINLIYSGEVIQSYRDGLEIDIYLPELKIGFEFNGLYWHSELFKNKNYHINKTNYFKEKGIRIIHIWEDDWDNKKEIIKSQILNWIGLTKYRIFARKCEIKEIESTKEYKEFLDNNHIQGFTSASIRIGLYYNNTLVSLMTFDHFEGRKKMLNNEWNLSRFCNILNTNVIGGASKLIKYFIKKYKPNRVISFSDLSWSLGNIYYKLGFIVKSVSYPNYSYLIDGKRSNKQKWKKSNLVKLGHDKLLSESKIMEDFYGSYKIFDCGQVKFELLLKSENIE